ncbi:MAG: BrnA antitoxin family protein [Terriglobales bacterium]|jgi:uncharacterized protein (DUF4415 family)
MKQKKQVAKRTKSPRKVGKPEASVGSKKRARFLPDDLDGMYKPVKKPITVRLDADILEWFQRDGRGYQTRINEALRRAMLQERNKD